MGERHRAGDAVDGEALVALVVAHGAARVRAVDAVGRECIVADRVMLIDFDHGVVEEDRPVRLQGIYKRDVNVGHNCWIGYGACILRGATIGDNAIVGTSTVVTKDVPPNAVAGGVPARILRMREEPETLRWGD